MNISWERPASQADHHPLPMPLGAFHAAFIWPNKGNFSFYWPGEGKKQPAPPYSEALSLRSNASHASLTGRRGQEPTTAFSESSQDP